MAARLARFQCALLLTLVLVFPLFFIGGPDAVSAPVWRALWNAGHLVFFALLGLAVGLWLQVKGRSPSPRFCGGALLALLLASLLIEWLQGRWGREFSLVDVGNNLLGFWLGLAWFPGVMRGKPAPLSLRLALVLPALPALVPIALGAALQVQQAWRFPRLAGFESALELRAVTGAVALSEQQVSQGERALAVRLQPAPYSGVFVRRFAGDWSPYHHLAMDIYLASQAPLSLSLRISDRQHERNQRQHYDDRFNTRLVLQPGWNQVRVALEEVRRAPRDRQMNMGQIDTLGLFATRLPQPVQIYWDNVRLE